MQRIKRIIKNHYVINTLITILIYLIFLGVMKINPFGEKSILKGDLYQQYVNFFCYYRDVILNNKSLMMSWNLGMGNNFFTTFAYYLTSPLNIMVVFFENVNMDLFVEILLLIKIILISNSMVFYLKNTYKYEKIDVIIFGIIYAYCSYVICYGYHIMWLDCLYVLPITLHFIDKFIKGGKIYPIICCLAYGLWTNYYIGFSLAFYAGIYFLIKYTITYKIEIKKDYIKKSIIKLIIFLLTIIVSFGIIMVLFIPSMKQLSSNMHTTSIKLIELNKDKLILFINVLFNNYIYMFTQKSGMLFSSTIVMLLMPMYYLNKKIDKKEKILFTCAVIFLLMPIISPFLNKIWHGFTDPNCFYYRYAFVLIFTTILMAFREYQNIENTEKKHFIISGIIFTILTTIEIIFTKMGYLKSDGYEVSYKGILISCIVYLIMMLLIYFKVNLNISNKKITNILTICIFVIVVTDLLIGAKNGLVNNDKYFDTSVFKQYDKVMERLSELIDSPETERVYFAPDEYGSNMSMKFNYSSIGYFTSARNKKTIKAMYSLGYDIQRADQLWLTSFSGSAFNYDIAGVKYYITKEKDEISEIYGFELKEECDGFYIYENQYKFDMGYYLSNNIEVNDEQNSFEIQNQYINNLNENDENIKYYENIENTSTLIVKKDIQYDEPSEIYTIKYAVEAIEDSTIYLCSNNTLQLYLDGEAQYKDYANLWSYEAGIKKIKNLEKGQNTEFTIEVKKENLDAMNIYVSNNNLIQKAFDNMKKNKFENVEILSNGLSGNTNFEENGYLALAISYDEGWHVFVDGVEVEKTAIAGSYLGVKVDSGVHNVKIYYEVPGYRLGAKITIISILLLTVIIIIEIKCNNKGENNEGIFEKIKRYFYK